MHQLDNALLTSVEVIWPRRIALKDAAVNAKKAAALHLLQHPFGRDSSSHVAKAVGWVKQADLPPFRQLLQADPCFKVLDSHKPEAHIMVDQSKLEKAAQQRIQAAIDAVYPATPTSAKAPAAAAAAELQVKRAAALLLRGPPHRSRCSKVIAAINHIVGARQVHLLCTNTTIWQLLAAEPWFSVGTRTNGGLLEDYLKLDVQLLLEAAAADQVARPAAPPPLALAGQELTQLDSDTITSDSWAAAYMKSKSSAAAAAEAQEVWLIPVNRLPGYSVSSSGSSTTATATPTAAVPTVSGSWCSLVSSSSTSSVPAPAAPAGADLAAELGAAAAASSHVAAEAAVWTASSWTAAVEAFQEAAIALMPPAASHHCHHLQQQYQQQLYQPADERQKLAFGWWCQQQQQQQQQQQDLYRPVLAPTACPATTWLLPWCGA